MKVTVVFQKDDIQQLVMKELRAKGLRPVAGSDIKIKGMPKEVVVVVDVSEFPDAPVPDGSDSTANNPPAAPPPGPVKRELSTLEETLASTPMETILEASNHIKNSTPKTASPPKTMGRVQVFTDFPDEDRVK